MALTKRQIERYSRQLIVPQFGAAAQERLLAAHVFMAGGHQQYQSVLPYLAGAGVGRIGLWGEQRSAMSAAAAARDLNPDVTVQAGTDCSAESLRPGTLDLILILVGDGDTLALARTLFDRTTGGIAAALRPDCAIVMARLDAPARIAVIPRRPPCPRCANAGRLLDPIAAPADTAAFVASLAALEALKLLARFRAPERPTLIEFDGYAAAARSLEARPECGCADARAADTSR